MAELSGYQAIAKYNQDRADSLEVLLLETREALRVEKENAAVLRDIVKYEVDARKEAEAEAAHLMARTLQLAAEKQTAIQEADKWREGAKKWQEAAEAWTVFVDEEAVKLKEAREKIDRLMALLKVIFGGVR